MLCPSCQTSTRPGALRCLKCDAALPPTCVSCGERVPEGTELCGNCSTERVPSATLASLAAEDLFPAPPTDSTRVGRSPYEFRSRFVGRESAHDQLIGVFDRASRQAVLGFAALVGPAGSGKTRLAREVERTMKVRAPNARFFYAVAGGPESLPYAGFVRMLKTRFALGRHDSVDNAQQKIHLAVGELLPQGKVTEVTHLLAHLLGVGFPGSPIVEPIADASLQLEARTFIAIKRFLAADAARGPLVLCLDDVEQALPESINLLHYLAAGLLSSPVMLLAVGRDTLFERFPAFGDGEAALERVELGALPPAEAEQLFRELLKGVDGEPPAGLLAHARKVGAQPRTLLELVRLLLECEVVARSERASHLWRWDAAKLSALKLPARAEEVTALRLVQMPDAERDLLEKGAACGEVFWLDAVVALLRAPLLEGGDPDGPPLSEIAAAGDRTRMDVARTLQRLVESDWLVESDSSIPGEREYRFAYPPLYEAVLAGLADDTRRRYHRLLAGWLELRPEARGEEAQEEIGRHLEAAGDADGAAACYRRSADGARARYFNEKAIRLYGRALACLGRGNLAARIHLWHDLGSVYELKGDFEAALGAFERMLRLTWVVSSRAKAAVAFNKMGRVWRRKGDLKLALEYLQRGEDLFEQAGDDRGTAGSLDDIGQTLYLLGRYDEAFGKITDALSRRGKGGDRRSIAHSLSNLGNVQKDRGKFKEAETCHREALELRRQTGDRAGVVLSQNNLAVLSFERGDKDGARRGWEQALAEAEKIGALPLQALVLNNLGELALVDGKAEEARRRLDETMALARDLDDRRLLSEAARNLGLLELDAGNSTRARELAARALEIAQTSGLRDHVGRALLALGEVHAATLFDADKTIDTDATGRPITAEDYFRQGVDLFREIGNEGELAKGLERFGRYKLERGDVGGGKELLREAHAIFSRLGMKAGEEVGRMIGEI